MSEAKRRASGGEPAGADPDTLSGLIQEIVGSPEPVDEAGWDRGLRPGAVFGRYELVRELGRGGFGVVWEARDRELGRAVAFKAVRPGAGGAEREERLVREAEAVANLSHPNLVTLHDVGRSPHGPWMVLELLRGRTLAERLDLGPLAVREALRIAREGARGLAHAHAHGVVHRDLKPANVFLCEDGQVKLLDFGLAHALGRRRAGGGTPSYMAPEQWKGAPEDERTDVFALGVVIHRCLTGELPFPDDGGRSLESEHAAPALEVPELPALGTLVSRMLEKDPVRRPRDAGEVLAALDAFSQELDRTPSGSTGNVRARRRAPRRLLVALAAVVAAGALAAGALWLRTEPAPAPGERVTVAVADFANQTGETELDGLSGMLITSLEQSRRLSVLTRVRMVDVLRQLGRANVQTVDEALGREVALAAGVRALVVASVRRFDQLYAIELKVLDPVRSEYLFTLKEEGRTKASIPGMIDRLSERTRERLRERPDEVEASRVRVADATTASFEAYQHYFRGDQLKEAIRYEPAIEEYRKAIALDPGFALAHYRISYLAGFVGLPEAERRAEIDLAMRGVDKVPEKERLHILAWKAHLDRRDAEARDLYARAVERYPQDKEALFMAGDLELHSGNFAAGLPYFERAAALDPSWEPAQMHVMDSLAALGRGDELLRRASAWVERAPSGTAYRSLAVALAQAGRLDEAVDAARRAVALDATGFTRSALADMLLLAGRYGEVEDLARPLAAPGRSTLDRVIGVDALSVALAYQGRRREALEVAATFPATYEHSSGRLMQLELLAGDPSPPASGAREVRALTAGWPGEKHRTVALLLAILGDAEDAMQLAQASGEPRTRMLVEASLAWRAGHPGRYLEPLRDAVKEGLTPEDGPAVWLLAEAAADAGRPSEAIAAVDRLRTIGGGLWRAWAWPRALLIKANALDRLGRRDEAARTVGELLGAWRRADPDLPLLADARALEVRLRAAP